MKKLALIVGLVLAVVLPALAQDNVPVTEPRVNHPFAIDWAKVRMLASRIFAEKWIQGCQSEWSDRYPSPSYITTTYGCPAAGDSLTPVNDISGQRPCWVFWKEHNKTGVAVELGCRGNWIVSTFVMIQTRTVEVPRPTQAVVRTIPVPQIICIPQTTVVSQRQYIAPATVNAVCTPAASVPTGSTTVGPWVDRASLTLALVPSREVCRQEDETCGKGEPGTEPPPNGGQPWDQPPTDPHIADPVN